MKNDTYFFTQNGHDLKTTSSVFCLACPQIGAPFLASCPAVGRGNAPMLGRGPRGAALEGLTPLPLSEDFCWPRVRQSLQVQCSCSQQESRKENRIEQTRHVGGRSRSRKSLFGELFVLCRVWPAWTSIRTQRCVRPSAAPVQPSDLQRGLDGLKKRATGLYFGGPTHVIGVGLGAACFGGTSVVSRVGVAAGGRSERQRFTRRIRCLGLGTLTVPFQLTFLTYRYSRMKKTTCFAQIFAFANLHQHSELAQNPYLTSTAPLGTRTPKTCDLEETPGCPLRLNPLWKGDCKSYFQDTNPVICERSFTTEPRENPKSP